MEAKIISTEKDHAEAVSELTRLMSMSPESESDEGKRLGVLAVLIEHYERTHFQVECPTALEALAFRMDQLDLSNKDLEPFLGSRSKVSEVLSGRRPINAEMMRALHQKLGVPSKALLSISQPSDSAAPDESFDKYPAKEMIRRGWISSAISDASGALRDFFKSATSVSAVPALLRASHRTGRELDPYALRAWLARILNLARHRLTTTVPFNRNTITSDFLKDLCQLSLAADAPAKAQQFLAKNGILLIVEPHLPRTRLDGAAALTIAGNPIIGLTLRYDRVDWFWFTLLHELMHVWKHLSNVRSVFFDDLEVMPLGDQVEVEADRLARDTLIPRSRWIGSSARIDHTAASVVQLATRLGVHPAIVAGRIRFETKNYRILSGLVGQGEVRKWFPEVTSW